MDKTYINSLLIVLLIFGSCISINDLDPIKECSNFDMGCCVETHKLGYGYPSGVRSSGWVATYQTCLLIKALNKK
jgi:hypothetical protein